MVRRAVETESKQDDTEERPAKKQKTSPENDTLITGKRQKSNKAPSKASNIIKLTVSPSQTHIVAVTDDKSIRVFSFDPSAKTLTELSRRCMPKRPCAIQVLPDNAALICGDKFGDVYSLPLLPSSEPDVNTSQPEAPPPTTEQFKPSATPLTVHSRRNLAALTQQQKQKNFTPRKDLLSTFTNTLLLGHVSMLTDMLYTTHQPSGASTPRSYVLTADRDEHIRISRGPPQTHVIEGYCLGHTAFINKICRVGTSDLLVSGGGDSWLGVWNWLNFTLKQKFDLLSLVQKIAPEETQIAVSGIWSVGDGESASVVVICERVKALFIISSSALESGSDEGVQTISLSHDPLDVVVNGDVIIVSTDARVEGDKRILCGKLGGSGWEECLEKELDAVNAYKGPERLIADKEMDAFLFNVANLRKRGPLEEGAEEAEADAGAEED
ncbi:tRNA methyltransferase like protein [Zymoseptoria brevis]|uniref:tRNA methyltransferase like protein n=1 Tax=Zymoseptoria brevis TaxID=1047168 RepID=A0A0F4GA82_9PEZI|nr:tRNA methyltransferase like protein [Zymoseptoria brevis]